MSGAYEHFFDIMEGFGFFEHIYEKLPEDFTAVFEIARVLEDETNSLTQRLLPVLKLHVPDTRRKKEESSEQHQVILTEAEEYESGLIKSPQHLPRIYNSQWLLPDSVFSQKLAKKELWVPYAKEPTYFSVEPDTDEYRPDSRKQKLYILLDTSSSMALKNRINLAKALVCYFLKHNMKELGYINLRTFDTKIGELHLAKDLTGFHALISFIMRLHVLGNGTAMANAISQAVSDINALPQLSGTEILIITDGACVLNEQEMRELLGGNIVIHTIKIGRIQMYASRSYIRDKIFEEDTAQHKIIDDLQKKANELRRLKNIAQSPHIHRRYEESLTHVEREIQRQVNAMTEEIIVGYGHELERLSKLFIQIDDIDLSSVISINEENYHELNRMFDEICLDIDTFCTIDHLKKLALINDHLSLLIKHTTDKTLLGKFKQLQKNIEDKLTAALEVQISISGGGLLQRMTPEERHDLRYLFSHGTFSHFPIWRNLIWLIISKLKYIIRI